MGQYSNVKALGGALTCILIAWVSNAYLDHLTDHLMDVCDVVSFMAYVMENIPDCIFVVFTAH